MASFFSPYSHEFVRLGACVPHVAVADPRQNADNVLDLLALGDKARIALMVFPELGISAYAIDDLLLQDAVLDQVERQLERLISASRDLFPVFVVGAPLRHSGHLYNCGVVIHRGRLLGVVPKVFLPNYREFYERRHFTSGEDVVGRLIEIAGHEAPFGRDLLFAARGNAAFTFHVEICEDLWVPQPPSTEAALAGAGERRFGARRLRHPEILADLDVEGESRISPSGEQKITAKRRLVPGDLDQPADDVFSGGEVPPLIKFPVVRQKHLGHDPQQPAAMDDDAAIVEMPAVPQRRPDDKDREEVPTG